MELQISYSICTEIQATYVAEYTAKIFGFQRDGVSKREMTLKEYEDPFTGSK